MAQASHQKAQYLYCKESLVSGYIAGVSGLLLGHPLDTLKVKLQNTYALANLPLRNNAAKLPETHKNKMAMTTQRRMFATSEAALDGAAKEMVIAFVQKPTFLTSLLNLYSGIRVPILTVGFVQSINFFLYESIKLQLQNFDGARGKDSLAHVGASAFAAGGIVSAITSPLAITRTKQQVMLWSFKHAAWDTWSANRPNARALSKIRNFYAGYSTHFICDSVGRAIFFTSYEYLKRRVCKDQEKQLPSIPERMASACAAGMLSMSLIYPVDVIRSKIYAHSAMFPGQPTPTPYRLAKDLWKAHGIKEFYKGLSFAVVRSGPVAAVSLPVYDLVWQFLSSEQR